MLFHGPGDMRCRNATTAYGHPFFTLSSTSRFAVCATSPQKWWNNWRQVYGLHTVLHTISITGYVLFSCKETLFEIWHKILIITFWNLNAVVLYFSDFFRYLIKCGFLIWAESHKISNAPSNKSKTFWFHMRSFSQFYTHINYSQIIKNLQYFHIITCTPIITYSKMPFNC